MGISVNTIKVHRSIKTSEHTGVLGMYEAKYIYLTPKCLLRSNLTEKKYKMIRMLWLGWRQKTSGTQLHAHTYCKPERKLHPLNNNSEWNVFSSFIVFFFSLHSSSLMDGKTCRCGFSLIWESTCFIQKGLGCLQKKLLKPEPLINRPRDCSDLCLKVLSRSGRVYNQHNWLDGVGTADKDIRSVCSLWVRAEWVITITQVLESIN